MKKKVELGYVREWGCVMGLVNDVSNNIPVCSRLVSEFNMADLRDN